MNNKLITALLIIMPFVSQAQLGKGLMAKVKEKVSARADKKIDAAIDTTLDAVEGKNSKPVAGNAVVPAETKTSPAGKTSYAKFDFIPGEQIIYYNDFSGQIEGELPVGWNSSGNGAVATVAGLGGNWMQLYKDAFYLVDNKDSFTANFTVEFDLLMRRSNPKEAFPQFGFGVLSSGTEATTSNLLLKEYKKFFAAELKIQPSDYNGSHMHYESFSKYERYLNTEIKKYGVLENMFNQPVHISMQIQKTRLRIWINENKLYDLPKALAEDSVMNQLFFFVKGNGGNDEEVGYNISNIRIAKGLPDSRHKLIDEGKFTTTGILFNVNSAEIKPESNGVLKDIAEVLQKHPEIRVSIVGHTDSDGSDAANLELSKKRAAAVKQSLEEDFGIAASRMDTDGKGESVAVGDNKTKEGKARNRRVEFIKL